MIGNNVKNDGFTLIELLVVVAIIGVLSSTVLSQLSYARAQARDSVRISEIKEIEKALALYYANNNRFPIITASIFGHPKDTGFALIPKALAQPISASDGTMTAIESTLYPQYLSALPEAPGGKPYYYEGDGSKYCLVVELEVTAAPANNNNFCTNYSGNDVAIAFSLINNSSRRFAAGNVTTSLGC